MPKCLTLCVPLYDIFSYLLVSLSPGVEAPEPKKKKKADAGSQVICLSLVSTLCLFQGSRRKWSPRRKRKLTQALRKYLFFTSFRTLSVSGEAAGKQPEERKKKQKADRGA